MSGPDDQTLIARAQRGDRDAFGTLATRHRDAIYSFAVRTLGDREQALDAAQEIFIRAYTKLDTFDQSRPWRPWLFTIAANTCTDLLRRRARRADVVDHNAAIHLPAGDASSPLEAVARMDLQRRVAEALQCLSHVEVARRHRKGRREGHHVPLHPDAAAALAAWVAKLRTAHGADPATFLFRSREGSNRAISLTQAWRILKAACRAAGVVGNIATHSMRKTFAMNIYTNPKIRGDVLKTQMALGHRNIQSTLRYLAVDREEIDAAILSS